MIECATTILAYTIHQCYHTLDPYISETISYIMLYKQYIVIVAVNSSTNKAAHIKWLVQVGCRFIFRRSFKL